jgi:membrane-associated protease RseP (regulator of RpoE activity)
VRDEFLAALRRQRRGSEPLLVIDGVVMGRTLPAPTPISIRGRLGGVEPGPDSIIVIDDVVMSRTAREATPPVGRFGFAFTCEPRCTASTGRDGLLTYTYYRYRDFPPITAIAPGSAAERAGLRVGDLVVNVEGHSVLDDEGAKGLARLDRVDVLHLTVRRDGKEIDYTLKVSDKLD